MQTTTERHNLHTVHDAVDRRVDFDCNGTLKGVNGGYGGYGRLPMQYIDAMRTASGAADFYTVYSYATPIAWLANGAWHVPNVKYSRTTSRHLSALHLPTNWANTARDDKWVMLGFQRLLIMCAPAYMPDLCECEVD